MTPYLRARRLIQIGGLSLLLSSAMLGCHAPKSSVTANSDNTLPFTGKLPKEPAPTYAELAKRHNDRLGRLTQFSAQAQVEIVYHDVKGKRRYEQADQCRVLLVRPRTMAVLVRKFGVGDLFWAGSNDKQYWLFDLTDSQNRLLYVGLHANVEASRSAQRLPIPVQPRDLPRLMGLAELPVDRQGEVAPVKGGYLVTSPDKDWRVVIDPAHHLPVRVELLGHDRQVQMTSLLARPGQVELDGKSPGAWPRLMERIEIRPRQSQDYVIVHLSAITDGVADDAIQDRSFDLERLRRIYKPDDVIDLDQPVAAPSAR